MVGAGPSQIINKQRPWVWNGTKAEYGKAWRVKKEREKVLLLFY